MKNRTVTIAIGVRATWVVLVFSLVTAGRAFPSTVSVPCCSGGGCVEGLSAKACEDSGGVPTTPGSTCAETDCAPHLVSCCSINPLIPCQTLTIDQCEVYGGRSWGPGTSCDENPCPTIETACCLEEEQLCAAIPAFFCTAPNAVVSGTCSDMPCEFETVACCAEDGSGCLDASETFCAAAEEEGAVSLGAGSSCALVDCPNAPTRTPTPESTPTPTGLLEEPPASACPAVIDTFCYYGFDKTLLLINEKVSGKEKLAAKFVKGPIMQQSSIGNPVPSDGTMIALCVYDDIGTLAGELAVEAGGDCQGKPCWKSIGKGLAAGYVYKDRFSASAGVLKILYKGGELGKSKAIFKAKGPLLPHGIPAALQGTSSVTVQLRGSGRECLAIILDQIKKSEENFFKAK